MQGGCHFSVAMPNIQAPDATGQVQEFISVNILDAGAVCPVDKNGSNLRNAACHGLRRALRQRLGFGAGDRRFKLNGSHQYHPMGCSFKLMWTCLVSRYSSMPQGPSSLPKPDCL